MGGHNLETKYSLDELQHADTVSKFLQLCKQHGEPLTFLCNEQLVWESCTKEIEFVDYKAVNLRPIIFQIMKELEINLDKYQEVLRDVYKLRTVELRQNTIDDITQLCTRAREIIDQVQTEKVAEVNQIFQTLKFDQVDDLNYFRDLERTGKKALKTIKERFRNMAFANIYNYRVSYNGRCFSEI